ncbi:hypothetical protein [Oryza sativa Japonica Group]|uniref:Uncharacterized protein n=1 Tax=Oryza sativa subsp. japonica TaxID=39947 RepID=Q5JK92_ORYSJ|nr:hypothetical protein [Oryza sativa Japonica Group]BAD88136.1 hypothetical protein [Oryza sativa Japonica Group]
MAAKEAGARKIGGRWWQTTERRRMAMDAFHWSHRCRPPTRWCHYTISLATEDAIPLSIERDGEKRGERKEGERRWEETVRW